MGATKGGECQTLMHMLSELYLSCVRSFMFEKTCGLRICLGAIFVAASILFCVFGHWFGSVIVIQVRLSGGSGDGSIRKIKVQRLDISVNLATG